MFALLFTAGGGLSAVIWTDFVQTILMVIGAFILMVFRLVQTILMVIGAFILMVFRLVHAYRKYESFLLLINMVGCLKCLQSLNL